MYVYQLTLENLQTGNNIELLVRAKNIDQAHYLAICRFGTDIILVNCRELKG